MEILEVFFLFIQPQYRIKRSSVEAISEILRPIIFVNGFTNEFISHIEIKW